MPVSYDDASAAPTGRVSYEDAAAGPAYNLPPSMARTATDWATSAIRGLAKGAMSAAGQIGDVMDYGARGVEWAAEKMGGPQLTEEQHQRLSKMARPFPTTAENIEKLELLTGKLGKPQTEGGKYTEAIGEFGPAVAAGPGGVVRKTLQAIGGGAGGEYTAQKAKEWLGPAAEPFARIAGAIPGLLVGGKIGTAVKKDTIPTMEALRDSKDQAYGAAKALPLQISRTGTDRLADSILGELKTEMYRDYLAPGTFKAIEELRTPAGINATVADIDGVRRLLGRVGKDIKERDAVRIATNRIDEYLANIPQSHVVAGDPSAVSAIFRQARGDFAALSRAQRIEDALEAAKDAAGSSGSGANINNAIRQAIKRIKNNPNLVRGFSDAEIAQMEKIIRGGVISNSARMAGKAAPTGAVSALPTLLTFLSQGGNAAGLVAGGGLLGKAFGDYLTKRGVADLDKMVRSRAPLNRGAPYVPQSPEMSTIDATVRSAMGTGASRAQDDAPIPGARKAPDGKWYLPDPERPGKYLQVQ